MSEVLDGGAMLGETVSSHHGEKSADHAVRVMGGTSDDAVELVDKSVVGDEAVDSVLLHNHMASKEGSDLANPAVPASVHLGNVSEDGLGEVSGVHVVSKDGEDLGKQLLLMQIVELESGVHPVDNGVLVDKSWELSHDSLNKRSGVAEVVHDVGARDDVVSLVHAVVKSGDSVDVVDVLSDSGMSLSTSDMDFLADMLVDDSSGSVLLGRILSGLHVGETR